jgi:hypothetical protein
VMYVTRRIDWYAAAPAVAAEAARGEPSAS